MKKFSFLEFAVISTILLGSVIPALAQDAVIHDQTAILQAKARAEVDQISNASVTQLALLDLMNDPIVRQTFQNMQWELLNTPSDSRFLRFFKSTPALAKVFTALQEMHKSSLSEFSKQAKASMFRLRRVTPEYIAVDDMIVKGALNQGFTSEAIANREIYIIDNVNSNAFTVSGNQNRIIVALHSGILKMDRQELDAVVNHEMGHIRSEHPILGQMHGLLLTAFEVILQKGLNAGVSLPLDIDSNIQKALEKFTDFNCISSCTHQNSENSMKARPANLKRSQAADERVLFAQQVIGGLLKLPKEALIPVYNQYFQLIQSTLQEGGAHSDISLYVEGLRVTLELVVAGIDKKDVATYEANMGEFINASSRGQEKSADRYLGAASKNEYGASAFAKLMGAQFKKGDRDKVLKLIVEQAQELKSTFNADQLADVVGTSHPALAFRVAEILSIPSYPSVLFANPFLRLLLIRTALSSQLSSFSNRISLVADLDAGKLPPTVQAVLDKLPAEQQKVLKAELKAQIQARMDAQKRDFNALTATIAKLDDKIFSLITPDKFNSPRNARIINILEFALAQKELTLEAIESTLTGAKAVKGQERAAALQMVSEFEASLHYNDALLKRLQETIQKSPSPVVGDSKLSNLHAEQLRERAKWLEVALESENLVDVKDARFQVWNFVHANRLNKTSRSRIPLNLAGGVGPCDETIQLK